MKKIEKTITRDLPLINVVAWHTGYTSGMKEWLGWSFSDTLFYMHDGYVEMFRLSDEHNIEFRQVLLEKIKADPTWFEREHESYVRLLGEAGKFFEEVSSLIDAGDKKVILDVYQKYLDIIGKIMGPFIVMYWLPVWAESDPSVREFAAEMVELGQKTREGTQNIFPQGDELIRHILAEVDKTLKLGAGVINFLSKEELEDYLIRGNTPNAELLVERTRGLVFSKKGITLTKCTSEEIEGFFGDMGYEYKIQKQADVSELKGTVACPGKTKGIVRVIMQKDRISTFQENEILVASMTTPEYLPAMNKAVAFITDEGGITCHAAIVARELGKPCIIGTKIATKVLHDGDEVEVDADNGIVRILKRAV